MADAADQAGGLSLRLPVRDGPQRGFDRRPIGFLIRREVEHTLDARDVDRRGILCGVTVGLAGISSRSCRRQQTERRGPDRACENPMLHRRSSPFVSGYAWYIADDFATRRAK